MAIADESVREIASSAAMAVADSTFVEDVEGRIWACFWGWGSHCHERKRCESDGNSFNLQFDCKIRKRSLRV